MAQDTGWTYNAHPNFSDELLKTRAKEALKLIYSKSPAELNGLASDTRSIHREYFRGLTPAGEPYYSGNYRGAEFQGLQTYGVTFGGRSGTPPHLVATQMNALAEQLAVLFTRYELTWSLDTNLAPAAKVFRLAEIASAAFVAFLTIHPYADGNGHMSRLILMIVFVRYGFRLIRMPVHPRPKSNPSLADLINLYRSGDRRPLISFVLSTL